MLLAWALLTTGPAARAESALPARIVMGYHESWWEVPAVNAQATRLAALPGYVNMVALAFARPDAQYLGALELAGTGLQYPYSGKVLRDSVRLLRQRQPGTRILLSVGGATYTNWHRLNEAALARLVADLALDGLDIDFEPTEPGCRPEAGGRIRCASDALFRTVVARLRAALPRPAILAISGWSVGAYGEGRHDDARPRSPYTGMALSLLRAPEAQALDLVSIMAYDAGESFEPWRAFEAYRQHWPGPLLMGLRVPYPAPDRLETVQRLAGQVLDDPQGGLMVYSLSGIPQGETGPHNPDPQSVVRMICRQLTLPDCHENLP